MNRRKIVIGVVLILVLVIGTIFMIFNEREPTEKKQGVDLSSEYEEPAQSTAASGSMTEEPTGEKTEHGSITGTWLHQGQDYKEYISFGSNGDYGYTAVPEKGNEQCFSGYYNIVGDKVKLYANEEEEELLFEVTGDSLKLGDKIYTRYLSEHSEEEK